VVVELDFFDCNTRYWLVIESDEVSVCLKDPGLDIDIVLRSSLRTMYLVWMGRRDLGNAIREGDVELAGDPGLVRAFPKWLRLSPASPAVRAANAV
jgi:hypothetical protein